MGMWQMWQVATENFVMSSNRSIVFAPPILLSSITGSTAISKTRNTGTTEHRNTEHRNSIIPEHGTPEH